MSSDTLVIEIFKPGTFTSVEGRTISFTADDLEGVAASYDPASDPAPAVIGHPSIDDPAWGWAESLAYQGDRLVAKVGQVEPAFAEAVGAGRYKRVSAQFYPKDHPANPKPGHFYLKHIGFLGAAPPAVKGLKPVSFSQEQQAGCVTAELEFSNPDQEKTMPTPEEISFAERQATLAAAEARLKTDQAAFDARLKTAEKAAADALATDAISFAESLVASAKLKPFGKDRVIFLIKTLGEAAGGAAPLSFGEGEAAETPVAAFKKLFDSAQPLISLGEIAKPDGAHGDDQDDDPQEIGDRAISYIEEQRARGKTVSASAAVRHVRKSKAA